MAEIVQNYTQTKKEEFTNISQEQNTPQVKSKFGMGYWIVMFFAVLADILDLICGLTIVLIWIPPITNFIMNALVIPSYLFLIGVKINERKLATMALCTLFGEMDIPMVTINLIAVRVIDILEGRLSKVGGVEKLIKK